MLWCLLALCDSQSWTTFSSQRGLTKELESWMHPAAGVKAEMIKQHIKKEREREGETD